MSATLTVNLDPDVLASAEQEARARHTTLTEVVGQQLRVMARNWQDSRAGRTPVTDSLRGAATSVRRARRPHGRITEAAWRRRIRSSSIPTWRSSPGSRARGLVQTSGQVLRAMQEALREQLLLRMPIENQMRAERRLHTKAAKPVESRISKSPGTTTAGVSRQLP